MTTDRPDVPRPRGDSVWTISVRDATLRDLPALVALDRAAFREDGWTEAQIRSQVARGDGVSLVSSDPAGRTGGACLGWVAGGVGELLRMAVWPHCRRLGHGSALLDEFLRRCRDRGCQELWLELRADNDAARALYAGHGFVSTGHRARYYTDGTDALLMTRWFTPR